MEKPTICITEQTYYGQRDEEMFFTWLNSITCLEDYIGYRNTLYVTLSSWTISRKDYLALRGLLKRYGQSRAQMYQLQVKEWQYVEEEHTEAQNYITLICHHARHYSHIDGDMFFDWIQRIPAVIHMQEYAEYTYLHVKPHMHDKDLFELLALFKRYHLDTSQLEQFVHEENKWLFYTIQGETESCQ